MASKFHIGDAASKDKRTFFRDGTLPSLPLPSIHQTIEKYLDSCKAILTDEEYHRTEQICKKFSEDESLTIQLPLIHKAVNERNWLQKWWDEHAYLKLRSPIMYYYFAGPGPFLHDFWPLEKGSQLERSAFALYNIMQFWRAMKCETFPQHKTREGYLTMRQFRFMFNTCRIPKRDQDDIRCTFKTNSEGVSPTHFIIFFRNRMYKIQGLNAETGDILTPPQFYAVLKKIVDNAPASYGKSVSALTCLERNTWADAREHMINISSVNQENLDDIENALMCFCLDESNPQSYRDIYSLGMQGPCGNRWSDKSYNYTCSANGGFVTTCDHSPYEAIILTHFVEYSSEYMKIAIKDFPKPWHSLMESGTVKELVFDVDDKLDDYIRQGLTEYNKFASNLQVSMKMYTEIGRSALKEMKIHPDGFVQICVQLTYMKLYGKPAPAYETATTRRYYNGRTETVRTCTPETVNFCNAYINGSSGVVPLFYKAHDKFVWLMGECRKGFGCDRHLMGIALQAAEMGEPLPALYSDPSFTKTGGGGNFILSTSLTGFFDGTGGVAPMTDNGYGIFYCINYNHMLLTTSAWNSCRETDSDKFLTAFLQTLSQVYAMLLNSPPAKL